MTWVSADDIRNLVERRWNSGDVLRALLAPPGVFPLRLRVRVPSSREIAIDYARAQGWIEMLQSFSGVRIDWGNIHSRTLGRQSIPTSLWIDTAEQALAFLQKADEGERFLRMYREAERSVPVLLPWIQRNPVRTLALQTVWARLLQVVAWRVAYPDIEPVYVRQVDLPGTDTKFIESHRGILGELFDATSPAGVSSQAAKTFHARHGFLREPIRVRFRLLDPALAFANLAECPDVELDEDSFAALRLPVRRLFATENKTNFLAFPRVEGSAILFAAGYGMRALGRARWIEKIPLHYWGDIDSHGFAILSQLREQFPHAQSFLMDEETLTQHRSSWTTEQSATRHSVRHLTDAERRVFEKLQLGGPWYQVRLEQEKVSQSALRESLHQLLQQGSAR